MKTTQHFFNCFFVMKSEDEKRSFKTHFEFPNNLIYLVLLPRRFMLAFFCYGMFSSSKFKMHIWKHMCMLISSHFLNMKYRIWIYVFCFWFRFLFSPWTPTNDVNRFGYIWHIKFNCLRQTFHCYCFERSNSTRKISLFIVHI